jgi:hypothetical protein
MRAEPYSDGKKPYHKDGIHILCPDITLVNEKQKVTWQRNSVITQWRYNRW